MKKLFLGFIVFFTAINIWGQDIIYKKNNQTINCKIIEIGLVEVKYLIPEKYKDVVMVIAKDDISKIKYENGEEQSFVNEMYDKNSYADNKLNAIKFHVFSPLYTYLAVSYERSLKAGRSIEGTLGIIGIGYDPLNVNPGGAFAKFGYKFIKSPDFYLRGMRYAHLLKGTYFKPEIALSTYSFNQNRYDYTYNSFNSYTVRQNTFSGALILNVGKQWVFDNRFAVDFSVGLGYGITNLKNSGFLDSSYQYGFSVEPNSGLAWTSNFKVAYLF
ncbi:MAG: hypothetical protein P4L34_07905 [Paludibacter sp.]|nr:hypothetical protein [Paludibacter sp.]